MKSINAIIALLTATIIALIAILFVELASAARGNCTESRPQAEYVICIDGNWLVKS